MLASIILSVYLVHPVYEAPKVKNNTYLLVRYYKRKHKKHKLPYDND